MTLRSIVLLVLLVACCGARSASALPHEAEVAPGDRVALQATIAAVCDRQVVLMGAPSHGGGHSEAFKVALLMRLVTHCGFDTVLFEASFYEFTPIARAVRAKRPIAPALVAAAVGGLWKFDREVQALFPFLASRAEAGQLRLGGLDFQPGGFEQPYSNGEMFFELIAALSAARRQECTTLYNTAIDGDDAPNSMSARARTEALQACLSDGAALAAMSATEAAEQQEMNAHRANLTAWLAQLEGNWQSLVRARDRMMFDNVIRSMGSNGRPSKVVIWTHNGHAAKSNSPMRATYADEPNLGTALAERLGGRLFALGITARGGTYRWSPGTNKPVPQPAEDALEARFHGGVTKASVFVPKADLLAAGARPGSFLGYEPVAADWASAFDGIIILDAEYPPHGTRP
jgi:erythromycin esterase-like protein